MVPVTAEQEAQIAPIDEGSLDDSKAARMDTISGEKLEKDDIAPDSDAEANTYKYVFQQRPRAGIQLVMRPKAQIVRRVCHVCEAHFKSANRTECQRCGHLRCSLCPRHPLKPEKWPHGSPGDAAPGDESNMVTAVQRVYRKPRQRVRWYCDRCQSQMINRERCGCGHERCGACVRNP